MKPEFQDLPLVKNDETKRFEMEVGEHLAFIDFKEKRDTIYLIHTETDPELAGTGAAKAVVEKTLHYIADHNKLLMPFCPYVFAYIKKNSQWKRIVSERFKGREKL